MAYRQQEGRATKWADEATHSVDWHCTANRPNGMRILWIMRTVAYMEESLILSGGRTAATYTTSAWTTERVRDFLLSVFPDGETPHGLNRQPIANADLSQLADVWSDLAIIERDSMLHELYVHTAYGPSQ